MDVCYKSALKITAITAIIIGLVVWLIILYIDKPKPISLAPSVPNFDLLEVRTMAKDSYDSICKEGKEVYSGGSICTIGDAILNRAGKYSACPDGTIALDSGVCSDDKGATTPFKCNDNDFLLNATCYKACPAGYTNQNNLCVNGEVRHISRSCESANDEFAGSKCYKPCPAGWKPSISDIGQCYQVANES